MTRSQTYGSTWKGWEGMGGGSERVRASEREVGGCRRGEGLEEG